MTDMRRSVLRSVRLDDDVWEAVKGMECSLNQYLRIALLGDDVQPKRLLINEGLRVGLLGGRRSLPNGEMPSDALKAVRLNEKSAGSAAKSQSGSEPSAKESQPAARPFKAPLLKPSEREKK